MPNCSGAGTGAKTFTHKPAPEGRGSTRRRIPTSVDTTAETIRGALAQAWLAWDAQGDVRTEDDHKLAAFIHAADFDALADLERRKLLDWDDSTMFAVIRSLRALAGEA
jgi:hypothetical protein